MTDQPTPQTEADRECPNCGMTYAACVKARRTHIACCPDCEHPDQPTPRTEALTQASEHLIRDWDRYPDAIDASELSARLWLIERQAAAQARTEALDVLSGLLSEVGFMRSCIASGERLNPDDLARQDGVMTRAVAIIKADR